MFILNDLKRLLNWSKTRKRRRSCDKNWGISSREKQFAAGSSDFKARSRPSEKYFRSTAINIDDEIYEVAITGATPAPIVSWVRRAACVARASIYWGACSEEDLSWQGSLSITCLLFQFSHLLIKPRKTARLAFCLRLSDLLCAGGLHWEVDETRRLEEQ